ncbi:MAG: RIO1 family regulatory kinase/ATPase [Candidatus Promineifilaceae bacterium]|jgi:RIO kinase 1
MDKYDELNRYENYEEQFNPLRTDRKARRKRRPDTRHQAKKSESELIEEAAQTIGLEGGFQTSYTPSLYESTWLMQSLAEFYQQELISDVQALVKGGKEASVYRCAAHPATGETWLAVKVYRPRMFRNLRNDHRYRQGRTVLMPNGRPIKTRDRRLQKALAGKTNLGKEVAHISWLMHEYTTLQLLYEAGGDVPRPVAAAENAILMGYIGDDAGAAPALNEIDLEPQEVRPLFKSVIQNIALMLAYGRVHGDLSAYNILYWDGEITLIDFPQVVNSRVDGETHHALDSRTNPDAYDILVRDVVRVCDYFGRYGLNVDGHRLADDLWSRNADDDREMRMADASRFDEQEF